MEDIRTTAQELEQALSETASKVKEALTSAHTDKVAAECFVLALVSHPAFDAVRISDIRTRAEKYREGYIKARRAERCLKFLEYIAQTYEDSEVMHPLARLFKHKISPNEDSRGNACFFHGDTVMDAIEAWAEKTSFSRKEEVNGKEYSTRK